MAQIIHFNNLPDSVVREVLCLLNKKEWAHLQNTSHHLRDLLIPLIWETYDEELVKDCFDRALNVEYMAKYGAHIRHLFVNLTYSDLLLSLVHCPNLRSISVIKVLDQSDLVKLLLTPPSLVPALSKISVSIEFPLDSWPRCPAPFFSNIVDLELLFASPQQTEIGLGFLKSSSSPKLKRLLLFTYKGLNLNIAVDIQQSFPNLAYLYIDGCFVNTEEFVEHTPKFENLELLDIPANGIALDNQLTHYFGKPANLPRLTELSLVDLPTTSGQSSFVFGHAWLNLTTLSADVNCLLPMELIGNLKSLTNLRLNFKTEESTGIISRLLSDLVHLRILCFSGKLRDTAFDFPAPPNSLASIELNSRADFGPCLIGWMVSLSSLESLMLPRIRVRLPPGFGLPFGIHFPKLTLAKVFKENLEFNSWIIHSSPKLRNLKFSS